MYRWMIVLVLLAGGWGFAQVVEELPVRVTYTIDGVEMTWGEAAAYAGKLEERARGIRELLQVSRERGEGAAEVAAVEAAVREGVDAVAVKEEVAEQEAANVAERAALAAEMEAAVAAQEAQKQAEREALETLIEQKVEEVLQSREGGKL